MPNKSKYGPAQQMLKEQLEPVARWLTHATNAGTGGNHESVHKLRVATRRASVALRVCRKLLEKSECEHLRVILRRVRQAANATRDLDVLIASFVDGTRTISGGAKQEKHHAVLSKRFELHLRELRAGAQQPIEALKHELDQAHFNREVNALIKTARSSKKGGGEKEFEALSAKAVSRAARKFLKASEANLSRDSALHELRIYAKNLRYTLELIGRSVDSKLSHTYIAKTEALQELLGAMHDHTVAIKSYLGWFHEAQGAERAFLEGLLHGTLSARETLRRLFDVFWSKDEAKQIKQDFDL